MREIFDGMLPPSVHGASTARAICHHPDNAWYLIDQHRGHIEDYYAARGIDWRTPSPERDDKLRKMYRHLGRASMAPLVAAVETATARYAEELLARDGRLVDLTRMGKLVGTDNFVINSYGNFQGSMRLFLYATGALSVEAAVRFLNDEAASGWTRPILRAYGKVCKDERQSGVAGKGRYTPTRTDSFETTGRSYFLRHVSAANMTVAKLLIAARGHAYLWGAANNDPQILQKVIFGQARQLSWLATTSTRFTDHFFPDQTVTPPPTLDCPFQHDWEAAQRGDIWSVSSLRAGPWAREGLCPAVVKELWTPNKHLRIGGSHAAHERLMTMSQVAAETLFCGFDDSQPPPGLVGHESLAVAQRADSLQTPPAALR